MILRLIRNRNVEKITRHWLVLKEHIDSLKRQLSDKHFITERLLANLQHHSHNTSLSSGDQISIKNPQKNIDLVCAKVDNSTLLITEITESIEKSTEEFKTDKRIIGNNANGKNIVSKNIE